MSFQRPSGKPPSAPRPTGGAGRGIVGSDVLYREVFETLSGPSCEMLLAAVWDRQGMSREDQSSAYAGFIRERILSAMRDFVDLHVSQERHDALQSERLFEDCFNLCRRLQEPAADERTQSLIHAITCEASETAFAQQPWHKGAKGATGAVEAPLNIALLPSDAHDEFSDSRSFGEEGAVAGFVQIRMPSFSATASGPLSTHSNQALMALPHSQKRHLLAQEAKRLHGIADDRLEALRLIARLSDILQMPIEKQVHERAALFDQLTSGVVSKRREMTPSSTTTSPRSSGAGHTHCSASSRSKSVSSAAEKIGGDVDRLGRRQDLSVARLKREANALMTRMQDVAAAMFDEIDAEMDIISELFNILGTEEAAVQHFTVSICDELSALRANGGMLSCDSIESLNRFPNFITSLILYNLPSATLSRVATKRSALQEECYDQELLQMAERQDGVATAYREFYAITGDHKYANAPNYSALLRPTEEEEAAAAKEGRQSEHRSSTLLPVNAVEFDDKLFGSCQSGRNSVSSQGAALRRSCGAPTIAVASRDFKEFNLKVSKVRKAIECYEVDMAAIQQKLAVMKAVVPLIQNRDRILLAKARMAEGSRERLLSRNVNMAKQLLEEERLRKKCAHEVPRIVKEVIPLCDEWERMTGHPLVLNGHNVYATVATEVVIFPHIDPLDVGSSSATSTPRPKSTSPASNPQDDRRRVVPVSPSRGRDNSAAPRPVSPAKNKVSPARIPLASHKDPNTSTTRVVKPRGASSVSPRTRSNISTQVFPASGTTFQPRR